MYYPSTPQTSHYQAVHQMPSDFPLLSSSKHLVPLLISPAVTWPTPPTPHLQLVPSSFIQYVYCPFQLLLARLLNCHVLNDLLSNFCIFFVSSVAPDAYYTCMSEDCQFIGLLNPAQHYLPVWTFFTCSDPYLPHHPHLYLYLTVSWSIRIILVPCMSQLWSYWAKWGSSQEKVLCIWKDYGHCKDLWAHLK